MNTEKLRRAFSKSDFDADGYLNEFETNHFVYLLFGHKNHDELYIEMCTFCGTNPLFGLNFDHILNLFPTNNEQKKRRKSKKKKSKKKKKKKKSKKHKSKSLLSNKTDSEQEPEKKEKESEKPKIESNRNAVTAAAAATATAAATITADELMDDLDFVDNWGDLPPSDNEKDEELQSTLDAENNLNHIRHISAFVISELKSDSENNQGDEMQREKEAERQRERERNEAQRKEKEKELFTLKMEISQWKDKFHELEQNNKNCNDRYRKLQKEYINCENELSVKMKQLELSKINENETQNETETLKKEKTELLTRNNKLNESISAMTENMDSLNELCEEYSASISHCKERLNASENEKNALKLRVSDYENNIKSENELKLINAEWQNKYHQISQQLEAMQCDKTLLTNKIDGYTQQLQEYNQIELKYKTLDNELHQTKTQLKKRNLANVEMASNCNLLKENVKQLQSEINTEKQRNQQNIDRLNKQNQHKMKAVKIEYEQKRTQYALQISQLNEEMNELKQKIKIQMKQIEMAEIENQNESTKMANDNARKKEPFNFDFFVNNDNVAAATVLTEDQQDEHQDSFSFEKLNYPDDDEDDDDKLQMTMQMTAKQKFLLIKSRMEHEENCSNSD
eukprot:473439_1